MILESGEPTDEVIKPEVPGGAEGEAAQLLPSTREKSNGNGTGTETLLRTKAASRRERAIRRATAPLLERIKQLETGGQSGAETEARPKPKRADFSDDEAGQEAFEDALVQWGNEKFAVERALTEAQEAERRHCERNLRNYAEQIKEAKEKYPDWDELQKKFEADDVFIGNATQVAILEMENGAEITYHLTRHPDKAAELGRMSQGAAFAEVVRLSDRLKTGAPAYNGASGEARFRPRPKVPAPVRTVSTGGPSGSPTFAEIAARPNYSGKARDLKRALAAERGD